MAVCDDAWFGRSDAIDALKMLSIFILCLQGDSENALFEVMVL